MAKGGAPDVLVIGGGVFGLSAALAAVRTGLSVTLAEAGRIGDGASGGPVGALVPMSPGGWDARKTFQLAGLTTLEAEAARLADESGSDPGWRRTGRLVPLGDETGRERALADAEAARRHWPEGVDCEVLDAPPGRWADWLDPAAAPAGVVRETLSARLNPRDWVGALGRAVAAGGGRLLEGRRLEALEPEGGARFDRGRLAAGHVVVATGWRSFAHAAPLAALDGGGVKGQAALLDARAPEGVPLIAGRGLFVVPQPGGVAVGSTREREWVEAGPDERLDAVIERARALSPLLADAPVRARWAGIRPRATGALPLVGPLPGHPRVIVATGAQGIGFAIAHLVGAAVAGMITGAASAHALPPGTAPQLPFAPPPG